jgi:hypothetical protein
VFRFSVRRAPLPGRYGVWDAHANDWYSDWGLTEPEASRQATDLDVLYDFYTERRSRDVRRLDDPRTVELYDEHGLYHWHRADDLQPAAS